MRKIVLLIAGFFSVALGFVACGSKMSATGGAEIGNPAKRFITGTLVTSSTPAQLMAESNGPNCEADGLIATDSLAQATSAVLATDCSFEIELTINKSYVLSFVLNDTFVATLVFSQGSSTLASSMLVVSSGDSAIDLGAITLAGKIASATNNPYTQSDQDGDGVNDFNDDDDNNDGTPDGQELDCDLDGYLDYLDEGDEECEDDDDTDDEADDEAEEGSPIIYEVRPRNQATNVDLEVELEVRTGCTLDAGSINNTTISVTSSTDTIDCQFELESSDTRVTCESDDVFSANTVYQVQLEGVLCLDGDPLPPTTWSFTTAADDNGDDEDAGEEEDDDEGDD